MRRKDPASQPPTVAIALMVGFALLMGFVGLVSIVIPGAALMLLAMILLSGFFVAQYFVWGRWLHRYVVAKDLEEQQRLEQSSRPSGLDVPAE